MPPTERDSRGSAVNEAAEKALKERARVYAAYRRRKTQHRRELYDQEPHLRAFAQQLNRFDAEDAAAFLAYVREEARLFLATAMPEIRAEALSLVNERIMRIRGRAGLLPLDDPLPGEADDVWQLCKRELA